MPQTRRRRDNLSLAPSFIVAGVCATVLASLVADWGVNPFRGQRLAPSPAAAEGGAAPPAIALPPVQAVTLKPARRKAGSRARRMPSASTGRRNPSRSQPARRSP